MIKATPEQLREAVTSMDIMAQDAFNRIASMARLALLALEQPATYANGICMDHVAHMLESIEAMANDNNISETAEGVGCNYVDLVRRKRWVAIRESRESAIGKNGGAA